MLLELPDPSLHRRIESTCPPASLLFFGLNYAPELIGVAPYTAGLADELSARGHRVRVVAGQPYYPRWRVEGKAEGAWVREGVGGAEVYRCPLYVPSRPTFIRRLVHYASFAASAAVPMLRAVRRERPDAIFAVAPSLVSCLLALVIAKLFRVKFWLHLQDFEVEMAAATGLIGRESRVYRLALALEAFVLRRADVVSTISSRMCERLRSKGVRPARIFEMRNWANHASLIARAEGRGRRRQLRLCGKKVALYSGNIAAKQGLDLLIAAAHELRRTRPDIVILICGDGPNRAALEAEASALPNVRVDRLQRPEIFAEYLAMADMHLLPQMEGAADLVLPSKLTNMLASGRPVVATAAPGSGLAIEALGCGLVVPPGDARALARAMTKLADDPELADAFGAEGRRRAEARWSLDLTVDRFERRLDTLLDRPGRSTRAALAKLARTVRPARRADA